jgi:hypothetical protein
MSIDLPTEPPEVESEDRDDQAADAWADLTGVVDAVWREHDRAHLGARMWCDNPLCTFTRDVVANWVQ